ncbi:hypothetical protein D3C84_646680 [compost metagenome]
MGVALDADLGQMDDGDIPSVLVHQIPPLAGHRQPYSPAVLGGHGSRFVWDVVAIQDQHRDPGQAHELRHRHRLPLQGIERARHGGWQRLLREEEATAWFERDYGLHLVAFYGGMPARSAPLRVGEQDGRTTLVHHSRHGIGDDVDIKGPCVGCHLAEILVQHRLILRELDVFEIIRPDAKTELIEPQLLIRLGGHCPLHHAATRAASAGLIDQIGRKPPAQEQGLETFPAIRRGLPGTGRLTSAVEHDDRIRVRVGRDLIEDAGVIPMVGLTGRLQWLLGVKLAGGGDDGAPRGKAALLLNNQGIGMSGGHKHPCQHAKKQ